MYSYLDNILFTVILFYSLFLFYKNIKKIYRNINLGHKYIIEKNSVKKRFWSVIKMALGFSKMNSTKPFIVIFHSIIYFGFIILCIELTEIIIDGISCTHRAMSFLGKGYIFFTYILEIISILIIFSCLFFLSRRLFLNIPRLNHKDLIGFPKKDGIYILLLELAIMSTFLFKNSLDFHLMSYNNNIIGTFPISSNIKFNFYNNIHYLYFFERLFWWIHILSILFFMNYLYYSKHLHIITVFPNVYYSDFGPLGKFNNLPSVTYELKSILGLLKSNENVYTNNIFGVRDIFDLNKKQLINAYACTQCGRCTDVCPQSITGKKLSPRKIMILTRNRIEAVSKNIDYNGKFLDDKNYLLDGFISREEIWACNACLACNNACPINIEPLSIIMDIRRYIFLEEAKAPKKIHDLSNNIEIYSSPWKTK